MASYKGTCSRYCFFHQLLLNSFITYEGFFFFKSLWESTNFKIKLRRELVIFTLTILNLAPKVNHHTKHIVSSSEQYSKFFTKDKSAFVTK